jgi:sortase A
LVPAPTVEGVRGAPRLAVLALSGSLVGLLGACASEAGSARPATTRTAEPQATREPPPPRTAPRTPRPARGPEVSDGRPQQARLTVPRIGLRDLPVVPYRGFTDDAPGTRIQDGGVAASPHGPRGGVGPGGVGNYQVTAHRLSSTQAFLRLPELRRGDRVHVHTADRRWTYRIVGTRETSFRSPASLRAQRAAVPGQPGVAPTRAMITLSTCATPEDRAEGNYWSDEFGNPEHRIDKIGVLVRSEEMP